MKKTFLWFMKAFIAGVLTLCLTNTFCYFYYNLPAHNTSTTGATDYVWEENEIAIRGTEGFAKTKVDSYGFVNTFPYKSEKIDFLVMGSSHAEGFNVNTDKNFTYILNSKIKDNGSDKYVYSIAVSGHNLIKCLRNLDSALRTYEPTEYVIIETNQIDFSVELWQRLNDGTLEYENSYDRGLIYYLQKIDLFRLAYSQLSNFYKNNITGDENQGQQEERRENYQEQYSELVDAAFKNVNRVISKNNCKILIVYCPEIKVDYDGKVVEQECSFEYEVFKSACNKYGVEFLDMYDSYKEMYYETNKLPRGFSNTAVGVGHTNEYGHECIAQELYEYLVER